MLCYIYTIMLCEDTIVQLIQRRYSLRSRVSTRFYRRDREWRSSRIYFYQKKTTLTEQLSMTTTKNNILLPYLEDTGLDGKKVQTPKEWTERLRHYRKRIHNIDIKPGLCGEVIPTSNEWTTKEPEIRQDFISEAGPSAIETITKGVFNTDPDTINTEKLSNYSETTICQNKTPTTAEEISSGQNKRKTKHRKNTVGN